MSTTKKKKIYLSLEQRVAAIKLLESGKSAKVVAEQFGCGRTQIQVCKISHNGYKINIKSKTFSVLIFYFVMFV